MLADLTPEEQRQINVFRDAAASVQLIAELTARGDGELSVRRLFLENSLLIRWTWRLGPHAGAFVEVRRLPADLVRGLYVLKGQAELVRAGIAGIAQRPVLEFGN